MRAVVDPGITPDRAFDILDEYGYLIVRKDGHAKLLHDDRMPASVQDAHVEERRVVVWNWAFRLA